MTAKLDASFPATMPGMAAALDTIDETGRRWNLDAGVVARLRIVVEELFSNTVKYGYAGECERPVRLSLRRQVPVQLVFEDEAPPFDPTRWQPPAGVDIASPDRPEGQCGILVVLGLSATAVYSRIATGNRLTLTIASG